MNEKEITKRKEKIQRSMNEIGAILSQINNELKAANTTIFTGEASEIRDALQSRAILELQYSVGSKCLQEAQAALRQIEEDKTTEIEHQEKSRKEAMFQLVKEGKRLPPCPNCQKTERVKWSGQPPDSTNRRFWTDPECRDWAIPMVCDRTECKVRFWFRPERNGSKALKPSAQEEAET